MIEGKEQSFHFGNLELLTFPLLGLLGGYLLLAQKRRRRKVLSDVSLS
jgi:hypothetical protein